MSSVDDVDSADTGWVPGTDQDFEGAGYDGAGYDGSGGSSSGSWLDRLLGVAGPAVGSIAVSYGLSELFPGFNEAQITQAGYLGDIPQYSALRHRVPGPSDVAGPPVDGVPQPAPAGIIGAFDPQRRPGSGGQRYFTDVQYVPKGQGTTPQTDPAALAALNARNPNRELRMAGGGIAYLNKGKYLDGASDGMADKVPATIDGAQKAALSDGEFVVPADVVSHLGNGNSDSGAKVLYSMMDRVRKARTGTKKQGKKINPNKFLPA